MTDENRILITVEQEGEPLRIVTDGGRGPQGPKGDPGSGEGISTLVHTQEVASDHWTITHNWPGGYPSVTVVDTSGAVCLGRVVYTSATQVDIYFSTPFSGKVYLN